MTDNTGLSRRGFLKATGGAAAAVSVAGCIGSDDGGDSGDSQTPQKGGTLQLINSTMSTFDPVAADDTASGRVIQQLHDPLVNYPHGEVEVQNLLANSVETNEDKTVYTFTLKEATFHNGDPVTASDVVYSFERVAGSPHSVRSDFILSSIGVTHDTDSDGNYQSGSLGVTAVDEKTVEMEIEQPFHAVLEVLAYSAFAIVPEGIVGSLSDEGSPDSPSSQYDEFATSQPVGAGPFQFDHWELQTEAAVNRFDDYHGEVAKVDDVLWHVIEDDSAAFNKAMGGEADIFAIPTAKYEKNSVSEEETDDKNRVTGTYGPVRGKTLDYLKFPEVGTYYIAFNEQNVIKPVRQAVAYVFNQENFVDNTMKGRADPAYHLTPEIIYPGGTEAAEQHAEQYPYSPGESDIESAKQVMQDAGYGENNRYQLEFTHYESNVYAKLAQQLQQQLQGAFIDLSINQSNFQTLLQRGENGRNELYSLGWIADWPRPDNFMKLLYPPNTVTGDPASYTYLDWGQTDESSAAGAARTAFETIENNLTPTQESQDTRNAEYVKMEEANWEDAMIIPTHHNVEEQFSFQDVHIPDKFGGMGRSRSKHNTIWKEQ